MQLLRKVAGFCNSQQDLKEIYILFIRSILEQSAVLWHSSITLENTESLERVQKSALRVILGNEYTTYENALAKLDLQTLEERRDFLCLNFARKCVQNDNLKHMFPLNNQNTSIQTRYKEKYKVHFARTERFKDSPIIHMQNLLNKDEAKKLSF